MKNYVGIDLGTTNSAICSFSGSETRVWKSPEQNDVTPSAIYFDRRGNKYVGKRAYDSAPHSPGNAATLFKRLMGTSTPVEFSALSLTKTPEECSAEILKSLFGYLPEELRNDPETGTVITVPAAFNQMQKDATMQAAQMAGIGHVSLMQEPVAAVMSVMRASNMDGIFLIYDLGGGTLDIAIAESIGGRVTLLAHGGIAMCGGRDFDRSVMDNIVRPWLLENFELPEDFTINPNFKSLIRLANWATERAKIELSAQEETIISLSETEARIRDLNGTELYLDIPFNRKQYDELVEERILESVDAARSTLSKAGLSSHDIERIVFIGGPTNYKPLRDKVAFELGIPGNTDINPMTAVAEGASLFAESIDWSSSSHARKSTRGQLNTQSDLNISFNYIARTPKHKSKIVLRVKGNNTQGCEFQIDDTSTGWTSGRVKLIDGAAIEVTLPKQGENTFTIYAVDASGNSIPLDHETITITKTAATIDAIPASHSIGIEVLEKIGGLPTLDYLVRAGDSLPAKGQKKFKAGESLLAGSSGALHFKLWEGEIETPITDNRPVGTLAITGNDFGDGLLPAGADLICYYEILDSGNVILEVEIPSIGGVFQAGKNFYSRQDGQLDFTEAAAMVVEDGEHTLSRLETVSDVSDSPEIERARKKLQAATSLSSDEVDTETTQQAMEDVLNAKRLLAKVRKKHLKEIRQIDLDNTTSFFDKYLREAARESEITSFNNLAQTAQRSIDRNDKEFELQLDDLQGKSFGILWRQDWFVENRFENHANSPHAFADKAQYSKLIELGNVYLQSSNFEELRAITAQLSMLRIGGGNDLDFLAGANILKG